MLLIKNQSNDHIVYKRDLPLDGENNDDPDANEKPLLRMEVLFPLDLLLSDDRPTFSVMLTPPILVGGDRNEGGSGTLSTVFSVVGDASAGVAAVGGSAAPGESRRLALGLSSGSSDGCRLSDPVMTLI